jgi:hypothetical protein
MLPKMNLSKAGLPYGLVDRYLLEGFEGHQ